MMSEYAYPDDIDDDDDYQRDSTMDSSRYSATLNALIGHNPNTHWSPNNIMNCESCNKRFSFTRRRHHCRKCGCLVCHQCSTQQLVLPRMSDHPLRVCDSCFHQVNCNPIEDLNINSADDSMAKDYLSQILHVSIISKTDILLQAIIQGFSTALSGTPLGMEVDVRKFPPRSWNVRFSSSISVQSAPKPRKKKKGRPRVDTPVAHTTPDPYWSDDDVHPPVHRDGSSAMHQHAREEPNGHLLSTPCSSYTSQCSEWSVDSNSPNINSTNTVASLTSPIKVPNITPPRPRNSTNTSDIHWNESTTYNSPPRTKLNMHSPATSPATSPVTQSAPNHNSIELLDVVHYSEFARLRARKKAQASYEMYASENHVAPDYGVAIEIAFSTINDVESCKMKDLKRRCERMGSKGRGSSRDRYTFSETWLDEFPAATIGAGTGSGAGRSVFVLGSDVVDSDSDGDGDGDGRGGGRGDGGVPADLADVEVDSYYLFYWIAIWDGSDLRCGRSSQVLMPPCVCALLESPELFRKLVRTEANTTVTQSSQRDGGARDCGINGHSSSSHDGNDIFGPGQQNTTHTHHVHCYRDVDPELILISMLSQHEKEYLLSSSSMSMMSHTLRSTLHNLPSPPPFFPNSGPTRAAHLHDTTLLTPAAGLIGWLSGGKVNRNKFLESSIHMTMLPFLFMRSVYETNPQQR